jgi:tetratricopeptide (TPR) repeat protein
MHRADLRPKDFEASFAVAWYLTRFEPNPARARLYVRRTLDLVSPEVVKSSSWRVAWLELFPAHEHWLEGDVLRALAEGTRFAEKLESTSLGRQDGAVRELGNFFLTVGRLRTAAELFNRLSDPTYDLIKLSILRGNQRELRSLLNSAVARSYDLDLGWGPILVRAGFIDQAERLLATEGTGSAPGLAEAVRGELAMARGQTAEAIVQLKKSQESTKGFGSAFFLSMETLASALAHKGDLEGAVRVLEFTSQKKRLGVFNWVSNGPLWIRNHLLLARLYRKAGRAADAQRIEAELLNLLALADADHPILVELRRLQPASTPSDASARRIPQFRSRI